MQTDGAVATVAAHCLSRGEAVPVEIEVVADGWAFARTNSAGTTTINATGARVAESNQELFVFQESRRWGVADRAL